MSATAHALARKLLEQPDLPVWCVSLEEGESVVGPLADVVRLGEDFDGGAVVELITDDARQSERREERRRREYEGLKDEFEGPRS